MRIQMDPHHNPLRGTVSCEHCGTTLENTRDEWHELLGAGAARGFGEEWTDDTRHSTPSKYYPHMLQSAAEMLADRVHTTLFCRYCGKAVEQPRQALSGKAVLPDLYGNLADASQRWATEMGRDDAPSDLLKWNDAAFGQRKTAKVIWGSGY